MKVFFTSPTKQDQKELEDAGLKASLLDDRVKIVAVDDDSHVGTLFMGQKDYDRLGEDYIRQNVSMQFSKFTNSWFVRVSENNFYNDQARNPDKIIPVSFVEIENGTGRQVYRGEDGRYYLRDVSNREPFAKWYICGKRRVFEDGNEPRANLIFQCGEQQEKVIYDDWNGVAAYSDTFIQTSIRRRKSCICQRLSWKKSKVNIRRWFSWMTILLMPLIWSVIF